MGSPPQRTLIRRGRRALWTSLIVLMFQTGRTLCPTTRTLPLPSRTLCRMTPPPITWVPPLCRTSLILSSRTRRLLNRCRHPNRLQFPSRFRHPNQPRLRNQCRPLNRWRQLRRAGIHPRKLIRPPPPCPLQGNRLPNPLVRLSPGRQPESSPRPRWNRNTRPCPTTPPPITWEPPTCRTTRPIPRCKSRCRCPPGWNPTTGTRPRRYPSLSRSHPQPLVAALTI